MSSSLYGHLLLYQNTEADLTTLFLTWFLKQPERRLNLSGYIRSDTQ